MSGPWDNPETRAWAKHVLDNVVPMIDGSAMTISLVPTGETDIKFAVELGLSIMFDKPIILAVEPGTQLPGQLVKVADEIVEIEMDPSTESGFSEETRKRLTEAMSRIMERLE